MRNIKVKKKPVAPTCGDTVSLWKGCDSFYAQYEHSYPLAFPWNREQQEDIVRYVKDEEGWWYDPKAQDSGHALLSCAGDLMCEPRMSNAHRYGDSHFFHPLFQFVRGILKGSDFAVANLETTLTDCTPYAGEYHRLARKYHCNGPQCYLDALRYAGFDALVQANNHNCDSGAMGLIDTVRAVDKAGFMHTGAFAPEDEERVLFVKINGIKVAIMSYGTRYNDLDLNFTQLGADTLLNWFTKEKFTAQAAYARQKGAEFILVYMHWGKDYDLVPNEKQLGYAAELAELDVDYVVGSHTHCLQSHGWLESKDGRRRPMMWSMGNFVTNELKELCKHTGILQLELSREADGIRVKEHFVPCYVYDEFETGRFCVVPSDGMRNGGYYTPKMDDVRDYCRDRIGPEIPEPVSGDVKLGELCAAMGAACPQGLEKIPVTELAVQPDRADVGAVVFLVEPLSQGMIKELERRKFTALICAEPVENFPCVVTADVLDAYEKACLFLRSRFCPKTLVVAGREGKTLTKELTVRLLSKLGGTYTHEDLPVIDTAAWQKLHPYHRFYVQELRQDNPVPVAMSTRILKPDAVIVTQALGENEAEKKAWLKALADGLTEKGVMILSAAESELAAELSVKVITYSSEMSVFEPAFRYQDSFVNAATEAAMAMGLSAKAALESLSALAADGYVQNHFDCKGVELTLNLSCKSLHAAMSTMDSFSATEGRKLAVLGDLDGCEEALTHLLLGRMAVDSGAEKVLVFGKNSQAIAQGAEGVEVICAETQWDLEKALLENLQEGDSLLLCGGRAADFNRTIRRVFGLTDGQINDVWW